MIAELKDCNEIICHLRFNPDLPGPLKSALCFSSLVKYAKCFTKAAARTTKLDLEQVFNNELSHLKAFHIETLKLQEIYLASTGKSEFHSGSMVITLDPHLQDRAMISQDENPVLDLSFAADLSLEIDPDSEDYLGLYYSVMKYLEEKKLELLQSYQVELGKVPASEMYSNSRLSEF